MKFSGDSGATLVIHRDGTWKRTRGGEVVEDGSLRANGKNKSVTLYYHSGPFKGKRRRGTFDLSGGSVRIRFSDGKEATYDLGQTGGVTFSSQEDGATVTVNPDGTFSRSRNDQQIEGGHIELDSAHGGFRLHYNSGNNSGNVRDGSYEVDGDRVQLSFDDGGAAILQRA